MTRSPPYLSLAKIDRWLPLMRKQGVSEVARSPRGFLAAYRRAGGDPRRLSEAWRRKRDGFVARHMAQVEQSGEPLTTPEGLPTRRHLALIAWAYCPTPVRPPRANPSAVVSNPPFYVYAPQQEIGSAGTSLAQVPALHKHLVAKGLLAPGMRALDLGGGRYDKGVEFLGERGVEAHVYDPFNRLAGHNEAVARWVDSRHRGAAGVDAVLCSNVLNVIREKAARAQVIRAARSALAPGGVAYFWVYEGGPKKQAEGPQPTKKGWQNFKKTEFYLPEVRKVFRRAEKIGPMIVAPL